MIGIRGIARVPVILKGILNPQDARLAVQHGVDSILVSDHGGRHLDTVLATIESLPRVIETVKGRIPVLMDGSIRRGTDVIKALALGAGAVLIGRPYLWGLAAQGAADVEQVGPHSPPGIPDRHGTLRNVIHLGNQSRCSVVRSMIFRKEAGSRRILKGKNLRPVR